MRRRALHEEVHPVGGDVDARQLVHHFVHLGDDDAALERGGFDDGRRVLGIGAGVEIALAVGGLRGDQRHARREVDEVAGEQFQVGVNGADVDAPLSGEPRQPRTLRA